MSTVDQVDGESLTAQQRKIDGRALELGQPLDQVFIEKGVSGSKPLEKRPQGRELLRTVHSGDTIDGIAKLVVTIMSAVAEFERFRTRERVLETVAHRRREGLSLGGKHPPFGFKRVTDGLGTKALQPIREQQEAIKLMLRLKPRGYSLREIAYKVQKRYGVTITHMGVQGVIRREEAKSQLGKDEKP